MRKTTEQFIIDARSKHGDKYDYSKVNYTHDKAKVKIICPDHGEFMQLAYNHATRGNGCKQCGLRKMGDGHRSSTSDFIKKAIAIHGDTFDYSSVDYKHVNQKVIIICSVHGEFPQTPTSHLNGNGCEQCGRLISAEKHRRSTEQFIENAIAIHGNTYDYSLVDYKHVNEKVTIICPTHGEFLQTPDHHTRGSGCQKCNNSKGEMAIERHLSNLNIDFESQKKFNGCKNENRLPFDVYFVIDDVEMIIEFDGEQHFQAVNIFGGQTALDKRLRTDTKKTLYCYNNCISILRFSYSDFDNLSNIVDNFINRSINEEIGIYYSDSNMYSKLIESVDKASVDQWKKN